MRPGIRTGLSTVAACLFAAAGPVSADSPVVRYSREKTVNLGTPPAVTLENGVCWIEAQHLLHWAPTDKTSEPPAPEPLVAVRGNGEPIEWTAPSGGYWLVTLLQLRADEVAGGRGPVFSNALEADSRCLRFVLVAIDPDGKAPKEFSRAAELAAAGRFEEAGNALKRLDEGEPPLTEAGLASQRGRWILEWIVKRRDNELQRALRYRSGGKLAEARDVLQELVGIDSTNAAAQGELGAVLLELGEPETALGHLETALELAPAADTAFNLSIARFRLKKWWEAWGACDLCLKWAGEGTRLLERTAELGMAIARELKDEKEAWREIAKWAPGTDAGREAEKKLR